MKAPILSFEFFPPRNDAQQRRFWSTLGCLQTVNPAYISVTWGALGTNSGVSLDVLRDLHTDASVPVASHLTCVGHTEESIRAVIGELEALGISRFVALRGDAQKDQCPPGGLEHASELVSILAENPDRDISVAAYPEAHPESSGIDDDLRWLRHKLDAGASRAITQFFFESDTFLRFRDRARRSGIEQALVPGILPVHDIEKVRQFSEQCGATVPAELIQQFSRADTAEAKEAMAIEQSARLCQTLQTEGVDEFHIYTLNQSRLSYQLALALGNGSARTQAESKGSATGAVAA